MKGEKKEEGRIGGFVLFVFFSLRCTVSSVYAFRSPVSTLMESYGMEHPYFASD